MLCIDVLEPKEKKRVIIIPFLEPNQQNQSRPAHDPTFTENNSVTDRISFLMWIQSYLAVLFNFVIK